MSYQNWNASEYAKHASFVPAMASDVVKLLNPQAGEAILDVGCGDGELTKLLKENGCVVVGIDFSPSMVEMTKSHGIEAYVMDGHKIRFENRFDSVFSRAELQWLTQPEKAIAGVYSALKKNGRFVAEFGGKGNVAALLDAMQNVFEENPDFGPFSMPWYFPSTEEYRKLLEQAGFQVNYIELIPRPTPLKSGLEKWLEIFAEGITRGLGKEQKSKFLSATAEKLRNILYTDQAGWVADYVRLRVEARKT